jgi:serine/threonine protein kinase
MEAMSYLHSKNVYFGDMKPENLLVFRDYKVKLGDFGVSMKLPDDTKEDTEFILKGLTKQFST